MVDDKIVRIEATAIPAFGNPRSWI